MPKISRIRVLVVDDHMIVRKGLGLVLESAPDIELAGMAESGEEALHLCRELRPDVVLMDIQMGGLDGVMATRLMTEHSEKTRVIGLSSFATPDIVASMQRAGAVAFVGKTTSASDLIGVIRRVYAGDLIKTDTKDAPLSLPGKGTAPGPERVLGTQQAKVLALITKGFTNPEIADYMNISRATVSYHVSTILRKLDVSNRAEAVAIAVRDALIDPSDI